MLLSAEIRWFWSTEPRSLDDWYRKEAGDNPPGGGLARLDVYLADPTLKEIGVKVRNAKPDKPSPGVEIKGLLGGEALEAAPAALGGLALPAAELWAKWSVPAFLMGANVRKRDVRKQRWLRKFSMDSGTVVEIALDGKEKPVVAGAASMSPEELQKRQVALLPREGCNVEWTLIGEAGQPRWWTLGFEAFGARAAILDTLARVLTHVCDREPPTLPPGDALSYPAWLVKSDPA